MQCPFCSAWICGSQFLGLCGILWFLFQLSFLPLSDSPSALMTFVQDVLPNPTTSCFLFSAIHSSSVPLKCPQMSPQHAFYVLLTYTAPGSFQPLSVWTRPGCPSARAGAVPLPSHPSNAGLYSASGFPSLFTQFFPW